MAMDIKGILMELGKEGAGDAIVQYPYYKFVGDKIVPKLGMLGKWADVGGALVYGIAVDLVADNMGGEFSDYLRHGAASVLGRSISVAMGDPNISVSTPPSVKLAGSSMNYSTLSPVPLVGR